MRPCVQCGAELTESDRFCARCGAGAATSGEDALIGRTIGGAYVIAELVGVGGMGRVYRAEQTMLGRTVAIKVVHPHLIGDEQSSARFYTEARAASRLNHPNSVSIIDFGRTEDGMLYLVMEFLRGKDLARVIQEEGPLPFPRICDILVGTLVALAEAHVLDIVHRDLKPENIILEKQRAGGDFVKVVDFGLAKVVGGGQKSTSITLPGLVCGTPDYMSPEQGRGEDVDGRGDIYSMGVVLFELLTDRLPFPDDTPTKVVLRHITDPVPDPRQTAPHRNIPDVLADICMKAMSKTPNERFQTADEMAQVLRTASLALRAPRLSGETPCPTCGTANPTSMRFCGACGARLTGMMSIPPGMRATPPRSSPPTRRSNRPAALTGRDEELRRLDELYAAAALRPMFVHLLGEAGVGKTALLREMEARAQDAGDSVASAGPHATGAPVPYLPIYTLACSLLGVDREGLKRLAAEGGSVLDRLARAGVEEMLEPTGVIGFERVPRSGAVAAALATAIRFAAQRSTTGRVALFIDELHRCDGLTWRALRSLPSFLDGGALFVATAGARPLDDAPNDLFVTLGVRGLSSQDAASLLATARGSVPPPLPQGVGGEGGHVLPLYIEQLRALGLSIDDPAAPRRLADAVGQRFERLDLGSRRVLQAAAVLGDRCEIQSLARLAGTEALGALDTLEKERLIMRRGTLVEVSHPFVRDLVEASIPAEARKGLHAAALEVEAEAGSPLEVRAEHAYRAGETMSAMVILERTGDAALARGGAASAILSFRRGLDLARREMLETGDTALDRAIATFSRKLGDALELAGDPTGADGVLREALDLTGPSSVDRARLLLVLGRVSARRERRRDAARLLGQALELAERLDDAGTAGQAQVSIARLRREESDHVGAANALERAIELMTKAGTPGARVAALSVELGEVLADLGSSDDARTRLADAQREAIEKGAPALAALAVGLIASIDEVSGALGNAREGYERAATLSAEGGDAESAERWRRAAGTLQRSNSRPPVARE